MPEPQPPNDPLKAFTLAGRLLVIASVLVAAGITYWYVFFIHDNLPSGRYPLAFVLMPALMGAGLFFGLVSLILRRCGIEVWKKPEDDDPAP